MGSDRFRALVVDHETATRKLLVGALRRHDFECDEAADGEHAAHLAANSQYDAVITDLKIPKQNGHALVLEILQREKRPLVIVHTGVVESRLAQDLLKRGVNDIVYKPANVVVLAAKIKAMVERRPRPHQAGGGTAPRGEHASTRSCPDPSTCEHVTLGQLNAKLSEVSAVLPISHAALDVYEMTRSDAWNISQIGAAIQRDASLAVDVLRMANSSLYKPPGRRIISLDEAVLRIGQKRVGEMALAVNALSTVTPGMLPWIDLEVEWKRSMAAGIALESLVEVGGHQKIEEGLLLSAIMHSLGRVALAMMFPSQYQAMVECCDQTGESLREQERRIFPTSHTEVMAHLLATWRIPPDVFLPLKFSLDDFSTLARLAEPIRSRTELVKVAVVLGRLAVNRWESWDLLQFPGPRLMNRLRIKNVGDIVRQTRSDLSKLADFHPGGAPASQPAEPHAVEHDVAYGNPSGSEEDLLVELLPAVGLQARLTSMDELQQSQEASIVNCLGVTSPRFATNGGWKNTLFVTDQEHREAFDSLGQTVALPCSFRYFRDAVLRWKRLQEAGHAVEMSPCPV